MTERFEIKFKIDPELNTPADIALLISEDAKAKDACDCDAKGVLICQVYVYEEGRAEIVGKFVNQDVAEKIVKLTLKA